jgi:diaminopimelate decarboxylase
MIGKKLPFTKEQIEQIIKTYPTPFHIYDEKGMIAYARKFNEAFSWNEGFKEYYAIKAAPNPFLMKLLRKEGLGIDCSSLAELVLAERVGMRGEEIMFTSNDTPAEEFKKAAELGAIINLDDIKHIEYLEKHAGLPELICLRYNPGALKEGNIIIGNPQESKYGFTREQLFEGYQMLKKKGVKRFGIHSGIERTGC